MANKELVYLSDVRRAILRFEPEAVYILNGIKKVDAVEVVRCKDCKHLWKENELCAHPKCCESWMCVVEAPKDYFCAYGERRCENEVD